MVKSKQRVAEHGEVFTPAWLVEAMPDLVKGETERLDSRFLESACGSGNFLVQILRRKLVAVDLKYGKSDFERRHYALFGLMCIYGIELLPDNIVECRANLLDIFAEYLALAPTDDLYRAAFHVLSQNLVHGDALTMRTHTAVRLRVFNTEQMNQAAFAFRRYEDASLSYTGIESHQGLTHYGEGVRISKDAIFPRITLHALTEPEFTRLPVGSPTSPAPARGGQAFALVPEETRAAALAAFRGSRRRSGRESRTHNLDGRFLRRPTEAITVGARRGV